MITTFKCEICGKSSTIKSEISKCEEKGYPPKSLVGEIIWYNFTGHPEYKEDFFKVRVVEIVSYSQETHEPMYYVTVLEAKAGLSQGDCFKTNEAGLFYLNENNFVPVNAKATRIAIDKRRKIMEYTESMISKKD